MRTSISSSSLVIVDRIVANWSWSYPNLASNIKFVEPSWQVGQFDWNIEGNLSCIGGCHRHCQQNGDQA